MRRALLLFGPILPAVRAGVLAIKVAAIVCEWC